MHHGDDLVIHTLKLLDSTSQFCPQKWETVTFASLLHMRVKSPEWLEKEKKKLYVGEGNKVGLLKRKRKKICNRSRNSRFVSLCISNPWSKLDFLSKLTTAWLKLTKQGRCKCAQQMLKTEVFCKQIHKMTDKTSLIHTHLEPHFLI